MHMSLYVFSIPSTTELSPTEILVFMFKTILNVVYYTLIMLVVGVLRCKGSISANERQKYHILDSLSHFMGAAIFRSRDRRPSRC